MTNNKKIIIFPVFLFILTISSPLYAQANNAFESFINSNSASYQPDFAEDLESFYKQRNYQPVWFDADGDINADIDDIEKAIGNHAYLNALAPEDYDFQKVKAIEPSNPNNIFQKELLLSSVVMHYLNDIQSGRINPEEYDEMIFTLPEKNRLDIALAGFVEARDYHDYLETLIPPQEEYVQLRQYLSHFRDKAAQANWDNAITMADDTILYPGETHSKIPEIRSRLQNGLFKYDGELPDTVLNLDKALIDNEDLKNIKMPESVENPEHFYDEKLARQVQDFQYMHGLKSDGVIGPQTLKALKLPGEHYTDRIKLSMERWRWMPDDLGEKHIRLNIAAFYARAVENGEDVFVMPIIVGEVAHQTPIFSSVIKNVKIHPDWTSPDSIAERYLIPKIQKNPSVVYSQGYQAISKQTGKVVPWSQISIPDLNTYQYRFRQKPGENNALGLARFSIENDYAIFMHGTPSVNLFNEGDRTFSSGCVRLENPLRMAKYLLHDQEMSESELEDLYYLKAGEEAKTTYIDLDSDVPVHLLYMTTWIDNGGQLHFAEDVYGRDQDLKESLERLN